MTKLPILCPVCIHDINDTNLWFDEGGEGAWQCCAGDCDCDLSPADIARTLLTAEPTEAEVEAAAKAMDENFNPDHYPVMAAMFRDYAAVALRAAAEALR